MRSRTPSPSTTLASLVAVVVVLVASLLSAAPAGAAEVVWNVAAIGGPAPDHGRKAVTIAIVDSGVDASHPTFGGRVLPTIDIVGGPAGDPVGHGTHVAGTAAGGSVGPVIGVFPAASILPVRVLGADGSGSLDGVIAGIGAAADAGADVINLSLGGDVLIRNVFGSGLNDAINGAWAKGSIVVLAAGNDGLLGGLLGSGYGGLNAIVVTATTADNSVAGYATSVGSATWGLSAPGGDGSGQLDQDILSSVPGGGYALSAGTSMAAPHVSGAAAALRAAGLSQQATVDALLRTAHPLGSRGTYGAGLVDVAAALPPAPPGTTPPTSPPSSDPDPAPEAAAPSAPVAEAQSATTASATSVVPGTVVDSTTVPAGSVPPVLPVDDGDERARSAVPPVGLAGTGSDDGSPGAVLAGSAAVALLAAWLATVRVARGQRRHAAPA